MNSMNETNKRPYSVALDIGTSKVCVLIGSRNEYGKIEILGHAKVDSSGVLRGVVSNIEKTVSAIREAIEKAQRRANIQVKKVHVGIAGQHIKSIQHRGILTRDNSQEEINDQDIASLIADMYKLQLAPGEKIIHVYPQEYTVDSEQGIVDPRGMSGVRLEANFHIVTGQITAIQNLERCIQKAGLQVDGMVFEPVASGLSVLSDEEKEAGVALVDIGGGTSDLTIYSEGIIRHTSVIPFGGNSVSKDIKEASNIMPDRAEKLKVRFGSALDSEIFENTIISIPGLRGHEHKEISQKNLARIIRARVEEILDYVMAEIKKVGYQRKLTAGIVITGGTALLQHLDQLTAFHTGLTTRIGHPTDHLANGYTEELQSPAYATAMGLLIQGLEKPYHPEEEHEDIYNQTTEEEPREDGQVDQPPGRANWFKRIVDKTKEFIQEEQDNNL